MTGQGRFPRYPNLEISRVSGDGFVTLALHGELDQSTCEDLVSTVSREWATGAPIVVLDLRRLSFLDSGGINCLLTLHRQVPARGRLELIPARHPIQRVLTLTGVDQAFTYRSDSAPPSL